MAEKHDDPQRPILGRFEIGCGERRAVFVRDADGWRPDWFYLGDQPRLRFEGHHFIWLHRPLRAQQMERVGDGARFSARSACCGVDVDWSVTIAPDLEFDGFTVDAAFTPAETVELMKVMCFFETPAEWDNTEEALHAIGMNPVALWKGEQTVTPKLWYNPQWAWAHPRSHRNLAPAETPYLCTRLATGLAGRYYTFLGDWDACSHRMVGVSPARGTPYGYLFLVGAMSWYVSIHKDPNFIFDAGRTYRQKVRLSYADEMPGGTLDRWFFKPFACSLRQHFPADGKVEADYRARERGATLAAASEWWLETVTGGREVAGFYHPEKGLTCYISGPDPQHQHQYTWDFSYLWLIGHIAYYSHVANQPAWSEQGARRLPILRQALQQMKIGRLGITEQTGLSSLLHYLPYHPDDSMAASVRRLVDDICGVNPPNDHGV